MMRSWARLVDIRERYYSQSEIEKPPKGLTKYRQAFARAWSSIKVPEPQRLPDWADDNYFLAPQSSGSTQGAWITHPMQRGVMLLMGHDGVRRVVVSKAARVGYTKMMTAYLSWAIVHKQRNVAVWQPTDNARDKYVQDEINPLYTCVPAFADASMANLANMKDHRNTNKRKEFLAAVLHLLGGTSADNYRRITVDAALLDELDAFPTNVRGSDGKFEGAPEALANVRTTDSMFRKLILGSTPTEKGSSAIEGAHTACRIVMDWHVPCARCGEHQILAWGGPKEPYGIKWAMEKDVEQVKSAWYQCKCCAGTFTWGEMLKASKRGFWASKDVVLRESDCTFRDRTTGETVITPESVGVHMPTLISPMMEWRDMAAEFLLAVEKLRLGDRAMMRTFVNTRLGQGYEEFSAEKVDPKQYMKRLEIYEHEVPSPVVAMTIAVDVQKDRFELERKGWGAGEEQWGLGVHRVFGMTAVLPQYDEHGEILPGQEDNVWCRLEKLLYQSLPTSSGGQMRAVVVMIDSQYNTAEVYQFCKRDRTFLIPIRGDAEGAVLKTPSKPTTDGVFLSRVGVTNTTDIMYARYEIGEGDEDPTTSRYGKCHWPDNRPDEYDLRYFTQMTIEAKVRRLRAGRTYTLYECPPNASNEIGDLQRYNLAAIRFAQLYKGVDLAAPAPDLAVTEDMRRYDAEAEHARLSQIAQNLTTVH